MRVLIVDDEAPARRGIATRLRGLGDIEIVGECADGTAAVEAILRLDPDLVFLDIKMPGLDGFEVLDALPKDRLPAVIFLTAYEQHALRAFECHALDYLLKPIDDERFAGAVDRARRSIGGVSQAEIAERLLKLLGERAPKYLARFTIRTGTRLQIVPADEIDWIGGAGDYVELHAAGRCHLLRETLASLETRLDPRQFLRIHRSRIVRSGRIVELGALDNREYLVKLADGSTHRSSRSYADRLEQWLAAERA